MTAAKKTRSPQYVWSHSYYEKADPEAVGRELHAVKAENGGTLLPAQVIDRARDPKSSMHDLFEWDDSIAAQKHREQQARGIIRSLRVVVEEYDGPEAQRVFVHVKQAGPLKPGGYFTIEEVSQDDQRMQLLMQKAEKDLLAWLRRYKELRSHNPAVFEAISEAVRSLQ